MTRFDLTSLPDLLAFAVTLGIFGIPFFLVCRLLWRLGSRL